MIFVLGEYFAHVEKLLVIGMEHEQLPTDRDQGPLQLFWQSVEKRLLDCREALLKILQIEHILLDQRFQKREKQVEDIGSIERFFREEEALQSRKCLFVGCQNKLPPVEIKRKRECKVKRMRLVRDGKRSDQAVRQQLCAAVFDALRLQTAPEKRKSAAPRRFWKLPKTKAGKAGPNPKKSIPYVPPPENKQWKNIHKQKSRMTVVYRKKGSATRKGKTFNGKTFIGKNFLQWSTKCVMIKCSYQNYMTKYQKIHCVEFVPSSGRFEKER